MKTLFLSMFTVMSMTALAAPSYICVSNEGNINVDLNEEKEITISLENHDLKRLDYLTDADLMYPSPVESTNFESTKGKLTLTSNVEVDFSKCEVVFKLDTKNLQASVSGRCSDFNSKAYTTVEDDKLRCYKQ